MRPRDSTPTDHGRTPYADLKTGVLREGADADDMHFFVVDDRDPHGYVRDGADAPKPAVEAAIIDDKGLDEALAAFCKSTGRALPKGGPELESVMQEFKKHQVAGGLTAAWRDWREAKGVEVHTKDKGMETFPSLEEAKKKYPDLDPEHGAGNFTWAMKGNEGRMRFEDTYSNDRFSASKLAMAIRALAPSESDGPQELASKVHSAAVVEARLARENHSVVRHAAIAAGLADASPERLAPTAGRIAALVALQQELDAVKAKMAGRTGLSLPQGSSEGSVPAWCMLASLKPLRGSKYGSPLFEALRVEADRAMPPILGFSARMFAALTSGLKAVSAYGLSSSDQGAALRARFEEFSRMSASEAQKPGSFGPAKVEAAAGKFIDALEGPGGGGGGGAPSARSCWRPSTRRWAGTSRRSPPGACACRPSPRPRSRPPRPARCPPTPSPPSPG